MITLSPDEVAILKSILTALRGIKIRDIDKALVILSKADRSTLPPQASRLAAPHHTAAQSDRGANR